jgi:hypothetical protein
MNTFIYKLKATATHLTTSYGGIFSDCFSDST